MHYQIVIDNILTNTNDLQLVPECGKVESRGTSGSPSTEAIAHTACTVYTLELCVRNWDRTTEKRCFEFSNECPYEELFENAGAKLGYFCSQTLLCTTLANQLLKLPADCVVYGAKLTIAEGCASPEEMTKTVQKSETEQCYEDYMLAITFGGRCNRVENFLLPVRYTQKDVGEGGAITLDEKDIHRIQLETGMTVVRAEVVPATHDADAPMNDAEFFHL